MSEWAGGAKRLSWEELEALVAEAPVDGRWLSVNESHGLLVLLVLEVRQLRAELEMLRVGR